MEPPDLLPDIVGSLTPVEGPLQKYREGSEDDESKSSTSLSKNVKSLMNVPRAKTVKINRKQVFIDDDGDSD